MLASTVHVGNDRSRIGKLCRRSISHISKVLNSVVFPLRSKLCNFKSMGTPLKFL